MSGPRFGMSIVRRLSITGRRTVASVRARSARRRPLTAAVVLVVLASLLVAGSVSKRFAGHDARPAAPAIKVGELPERDTATSTTRRNRDGSYTTAVYGAPVNYRAADGTMRRIDTGLYPTDESGYAWRSGANSYQMRFKSAGADFAELRYGGRAIRLHADGTRLSGPARVEGSQITYPGAYQHADLRYQVGPSGTQKIIDLGEADAPTSYTFRLTPVDRHPLGLERRGDGSYLVRVGPGAEFVLDAPLAWEGEDATPAPAARPALAVRQDGAALVVTVSIDRTWLRAPERRFPVHLDPSITIQPNVRLATFTTVSTSRAVSTGDIMAGSDAASTYRGAVQFDLAGVPAGAQVSSAQLGLYFSGSCVIFTASACGGPHVVDLHRMAAPWTESSTYGQLAYDSTAAASYTLAQNASAGWMSWPVTALVSAWVNGTQPNYGVLVKRRTETLGSNGPRSNSVLSYAPKLDVTYTLTGPDLQAPSTVHANGAELSWIPSATGGGKAGYEVHRSSAATFTPSASTLVAMVGDSATTTYRDTTAAAGRSFTYRLKDLSDGTVSAPRTVTTPAAGQSTKVLQPGPAEGRTADVGYAGACNDGAATEARVGVLPWEDPEVYRTITSFDLRDIPPGAKVSAATLSMWRTTSVPAGFKVEAHALTRPWSEGIAPAGTCGPNSGASWLNSQPGQQWTAWGGDYAAAVAGSTTTTSADRGFDQFPIGDLVQGWVSGTMPNHGLLLRVPDEAVGGLVYYATDDNMLPSLRPKLTVTYNDGSAPRAPTASVAAPGPGARVSGSAVRLSAAAADDGKVTSVEFLVDGAVVGSSATAPYQVDWNSAAVANGVRSVSVRATDEAGNVTTSAPVSITVDNTAPPTAALGGPADGATVGGTVTVSATATDDQGVASVALLVDGVRVGAPDTTAPYSISWDTLDPLAPSFNGSHQITAAVTDTSGLVTVSAARTVIVSNTGTTAYRAGITLNSPTDATDDVIPSVMAENTTAGVPVQDPYAGTTNADGTSGGSLNRSLSGAPHDDAAAPASCPAGAYCPKVNVTNNSGSTWTGSTAQVWYRWYAPNGAIMFEDKSSGTFPASFANGATQAFPLTIYPPALPPGAQQGTYRLRVDVYDPATATWFSAKGNPPLDNPVIVAKSLGTALGLERYYQYDGAALGAGATTLANVANGDLLVRWTPFFAAGRGLATVTDLTYNSLEDHSKSPAGNAFSLAVSGLTRFGEPIDIHPNKADQISGQSNKWVEFTDGDGTTHHFDGVTGSDGITRWTEPPGVNLYLRSLSGDPNRVWAFTRPDKVTYFFDADGFPTSVEDRNGNKITYTVEDTPPGDDPGGPKKRITRVTDAGGRSFTIDYWTKDEIKKAHVRGNIQRITDHSGSALDFDYYDDGNLLRLTQRGGTNADGSFLADRSFVFTYTTSNGAGPAISDPAARVNPEPKTPNQSTLLYSVRDPRGAETTFAYYQANEGAQLRWKLKSRTDRDGQRTDYAYDLTNQVTTVTAPLSRATKYTYDTTGKVTQIVNPNNEATGVQWSADYKVTRVTEPTGKFTSYTHNANGYPTSQTDQLGKKTELAYLDQAVDANDTAKHLSLLSGVTTPKGVATSGDATDYRTTYSYDSAGNVDKVTDPTGAVTDYDYNLAGSANPGTLAAVRDANGNPPTAYPAYDPSGQPTQVRDALGNTTNLGYDLDGQVLWVQDPNHAGDSGGDVRAYRSYFDYDSFGRLGRQSAPKSTATDRGTLLWSSADYDANDNVVRLMAPHFGQTGSDPRTGAVTATGFDAMDRPTLVTGPDTSADPAGERTRVDYDAAGRTAKVTRPRGVQTGTADDFTTVYGYDPLDRVIKQTDYGVSTSDVRVTQMCYDTAGDLRSITLPRAGTATIACPGTGPANAAFTTELDYDAAHQLVAKRDDLGHGQRTSYDDNGNVSATEVDIASGRAQRTETDYDQRDKPVVQRERFDGTRVVTTRVEYDANGNPSRLISPRGSDAGGAGPYNFYVTVNTYDAADQLVRTALPFDGRDGSERQYVHRSYDRNGNQTSVSLPVTQADPAQVGGTAKTLLEYFDPGWIRTSDDPNTPKVHFDYTAIGQQSERTPETTSGALDTSRRMTWEYYPDGAVKSRKDAGGQPATYRYDADNNLVSSQDVGGVTDPGEHAIDTQTTFNGFDEVVKTGHRKEGDAVWKFTDYSYDANGNTTVRRENGEENDGGTETKAPRRYQLSYDAADWLTEQLDLGTDSACKDDQRVVTTFWSTGQEKQRDTYRAGSSCTADPSTWTKKQTTTWTHFDNGKLRQLRTTNGSGTVTESHDVGYFDAGGIYVNGNRTSDRYVLKRAAGSTATTCLATSPCDATYTYDARDRLVHEQQRAGKSTDYRLDEPAQLIGDKTIRAGDVTTQIKDGQTTTQRYTGGQLTDISAGGATIKYWYDNLGNQDCVTTSAGSRADCNSSGAPSANLLADYTVDYLNRLTSIQQYSAGTRTDLTTYAYDAMDRTTAEVEDHAGTAKDRTTNFTYQGLSRLLTEEKQSGGDNPKTKSYSYDAFGHRLGMVDRNNSTGAVDTYSYGTDVHGSISQLIDDAGNVKASYGYSAYGGADAQPSDKEALTTGDTDAQAPLNPMRFAARRADSGSAASATAQPQYDMGARRFGPDISRFLQQDAFASALGDLGLSLDPLTQNRYALAGGNPISYVEVDGHMLAADGGGGGSVTASPPSPDPAPSDKDTQGGIEGLKRFGSAFLGDLKKTGEGALHLYDTLDRCGSENDKSACDQLHQQFATKQGWTDTWNALKEPFVNDCKPSANRAPECAAHVASTAAEIFIGGKGAGRAASTAGRAETTAASSGARAEAAAAAKPSTAFDIVQGAGSTTRKINFRPSAVDPKWGLTAQHLNKHLFGSGNKSLKTIDPGGNPSLWTGYVQDLASRPVTSTTTNGMQDIIGTFPKTNGGGTFQFGIRLSPRPDGSFDLVTLLTKQ